MKARLYDLELRIEIYQKEAKDASNITWIVHWLWKHPHFGSFLVVYIDLNPSKWLCVEKKKKQCPNQPEHPGILVSDTNEELKNSRSLFHKFLRQSQGAGRVNKS